MSSRVSDAVSLRPASVLTLHPQIKNDVLLANILARAEQASLDTSRIRIMVKANGLSLPNLKVGQEKISVHGLSIYDAEIIDELPRYARQLQVCRFNADVDNGNRRRNKLMIWS